MFYETKTLAICSSLGKLMQTSFMKLKQNQNLSNILR